jgi:2-polyprenyl-6-methoxyphenol hydroxylase-like FAD-dependent oxidoreductase
MPRPQSALVIGSGIAGPAMAMALRKADIDAVVYEAHTTAANGLGTFLTLAANGVDALRTLDADRSVVATGFPTTAIVLWSGTGKRLGAAQVSMTLGNGATGYTLKRTELYAAINHQADRQGIRVETGKRLVGADSHAGTVTAHFSDGSHATGDVLIGCDGIHSTVRRLIDPNAPQPTYAGLINLGGYARGVDVEAEPGTYHMIFGNRAFFGYALAPDGEVWWFANVPQPEEPARGSLDGVSTEQWRNQLLGLFASDVGPAVRLIEATRHELSATPIHTVPHLPNWHSDRMIVIGDAAHAPSPSSGQGASLAIEDAVELAVCLRDAPDARQAFAAFEHVRRDRVERIIKAAARTNSNKAATGLARRLRDLLLPVVLRTLANSRQQREVYAYHIDWSPSDSFAS